MSIIFHLSIIYNYHLCVYQIVKQRCYEKTILSPFDHVLPRSLLSKWTSLWASRLRTYERWWSTRSLGNCQRSATISDCQWPAFFATDQHRPTSTWDIMRQYYPRFGKLQAWWGTVPMWIPSEAQNPLVPPLDPPEESQKSLRRVQGTVDANPRAKAWIAHRMTLPLDAFWVSIKNKQKYRLNRPVRPQAFFCFGTKRRKTRIGLDSFQPFTWTTLHILYPIEHPFTAKVDESCAFFLFFRSRVLRREARSRKHDLSSAAVLCHAVLSFGQKLLWAAQRRGWPPNRRCPASQVSCFQHPLPQVDHTVTFWSDSLNANIHSGRNFLESFRSKKQKSRTSKLYNMLIQ